MRVKRKRSYKLFLDVFFSPQGKLNPRSRLYRIWLLQYAYHRSIRRKRQLESRHFYDAHQIEFVISEIVAYSAQEASICHPRKSAA